MVKCICGSEQTEMLDHTCWQVSATGELHPASYMEPKFVTCSKCGIVRQTGVGFTAPSDYVEYYQKYPPTTADYKVKDWEHDLEIAHQRAESYNLTSGRVLDVGSGSGAFIYECRRRIGIEAYGCEIATYSYDQCGEYTYRKQLEDIHFPTDHFDFVTCHDVLEHVLDPVVMLQEIFRVTKQGGSVVVEIPRFFHESGQHHWKDVEHIWCFNEEQLKALLINTGFTVRDIKNPIESKVTFYCIKPEQKRLTILVPPGIGDSYWSIVKMQSFIKHESIPLPDVTPIINKTVRFNGHKRSIPFLELFPFIHATSCVIANDKRLKDVWQEVYNTAGRTVLRNVAGRDYLLCYNGHLRFGASLDVVDPHLACDWHPPMFVSLEQETYRQRCQKEYGKYFVCYFPLYGTYRFWGVDLPPTEIVKAVNNIVEQTGCRPVFVGREWDAEDPLANQIVRGIPRSVDLMGKTNMAQLFGLLRGAEAVVGFPAGLPIMSAVLGVKTLIIWNQYYNKNFAWQCAPPDSRAINYFVDWSYRLNAERLSDEVVDLMTLGHVDGKKYPRLIPDSEFGKRRPSPPRTAPQLRPIRRPRLVEKLKPKPIQLPIAASNGDPVVLCVLRSGGSYTVDYVKKLKNMVSRNSTVPHQFICLTDTKIEETVCKSVPLVTDWKGWYSKLELFRPELVKANRVVYFDLDTVIVGNIDPLLKLDSKFSALADWVLGREYINSSIMAWQQPTDWSFLYDEFDATKPPQDPLHKWNNSDQYYILQKLQAHGHKHQVLQDQVEGIYSYKRNKCANALPQDARVICFHGYPRPHQAIHVDWVRDNWL